MTVNFKNIPSNLRVPLFYAEVDNSQANTATVNQRALIIGQMLASGTGTPNVPVISAGVDDAASVGGVGSVLHLMTAAYRAVDGFGELWYLPVQDDAAATAATGSVNITAAPTANGTLYLYIAGVRVAMPVATTQTPAQIATALAAAINATANLPVSAAVDGTVNTKVDITALNKGPLGNDIDLRWNYQGAPAGEVLPAGFTAAIAAMTGGATAPSLTTALANLGDQPFDFIICPYNDTTSLDAVKALLNDQSGRWSWESQIYGHCFSAYRGTLSAGTTFGTARNNQHESVLPFYDSPSPVWAWAAAWAAANATSLRTDPALPVAGVPLTGILAPPLESRFTLSERNTLLYDGMSTFTVAQDGTVACEQTITTYQKNAFGAADDSYLKVQTLFTLAYGLRFLKGRVTSKYGRAKLAANGTRFSAGAGVVTPNMIRGEMIVSYRELEWLGEFQNGDAFKAALIVEQNATNPNRVDVLWPGEPVNQLDVFALLAQFRL